MLAKPQLEGSCMLALEARVGGGHRERAPAARAGSGRRKWNGTANGILRRRGDMQWGRASAAYSVA
eukprot:gene3765-14590_t